MRNLLLSACLLAGPAALAATMASQPWVTNRIAEAVAAIPQPGNYATVSNRAMSALQSHQSLEPSTNYTDRALAAFATTGTVDRAHTAYSASTADGAMSATWAGRLSLGGSVGTDNFTYEDIVNGFTAGTNYTDAVAAEFENGTREVDYASDANTAFYLAGDDDTYTATDLIRESTNAAIAVAARKQDALPYPTNAIPYAAIDGAPSGAPEWREVTYALDFPTSVFFVTNGCAHAVFGSSEWLYGSLYGWPNGASMFVRVTGVPQTYQTDIDSGAGAFRLVGYGTWPTNNFQSVWWRSGTNIFVNILVEE